MSDSGCGKLRPTARALSLSLGNDYYALPPNALTWNADKKMLTSDINKDKLSGAPHFAKNDWPKLSDKSFASQVYQYYGKQAYFETGSNLRPTSDQQTPRVYPNNK